MYTKISLAQVAVNFGLGPSAETRPINFYEGFKKQVLRERVNEPCGRWQPVPFARAMLCTSTMGIEVEAKYVGITRMIWMVLAS